MFRTVQLFTTINKEFKFEQSLRIEFTKVMNF